MILSIFDNNIACLLLTELKESNFEIAVSEDNKVYFKISADKEEAVELIEKYRSRTIEIDLKKYNSNRSMLLKKISEFKHNNC